MIADSSSFQFLWFIEYRQISVKFFTSVHLEQKIKRLKVLSLEIGVLRVGLVREQLQKGHKMLFDVVHDLSLLITDI